MNKYYFDMDGVLAKWNNVESDEILFEEGYFYNLKPAKAILSAVHDMIEQGNVEVYVLSKYLSESHYALKEKSAWLDKWLPNLKEENKIFVSYGSSKVEEILKRYPGQTSLDQTDDKHILIDDYTLNLLEWESYGGEGVKYLNDINHTRKTWQGLTVDWNSKTLKDDLLLERDKIIPTYDLINDRINKLYPDEDTRLYWVAEEPVFDIHDEHIADAIYIDRIDTPFDKEGNLIPALSGSDEAVTMAIKDKVLDGFNMINPEELKILI